LQEVPLASLDRCQSDVSFLPCPKADDATEMPPIGRISVKGYE
jgi:hypothetical protein